MELRDPACLPSFRVVEFPQDSPTISTETVANNLEGKELDSRFTPCGFVVGGAAPALTLHPHHRLRAELFRAHFSHLDFRD